MSDEPHVDAAPDARPPAPPDYYKEWLWHSDHLFGVRGGLFLLTQTVLMTVVYTVASQDGDTPLPELRVGDMLFLSGVILSAAWLLYCIAYSRSRRWISEGLEASDAVWRAFQAWKRQHRFVYGGEGKLATFLPPLVALIFWSLIWLAWRIPLP